MSDIQFQHLSREQLDCLLSMESEQQTSGWSAAAHLHLENCSRCRQQLEDSAATPGLWALAGQMLDTQAENANPPIDSLETQVADILESPRHPEMLGRLEGFEVEGIIGTGGNGIVVKGFDPDLNRPVAIKILAPRFSALGVARQRFSREARAAAAICHENVVAIHRINASAKHPFIVMPFVGGGSLQEFVETQGTLEPVQIVQIGLQLAAGLSAAHSVGVIHRDVKPANVLMENQCNRVLLSDFGLAQIESDTSLTRTGMIAGTPFYMSPEQAQGKMVDARSDLFALGGVLYYMAAGRPPFTGPHAMAVLNKICKEPLDDVRAHNPTVPPELANLIHRLLEKNPEDRLQTVGQVLDWMTSYLAYLQQPTTHKRPHFPRPKSMNHRVRFWKRAIIATGLAISISGLAWLGWNGWRNAGHEPDRHRLSTQGSELPNQWGDTEQEFAQQVEWIDRRLQELNPKSPTLTPPLLPRNGEQGELNDIRRQIERLEQESDLP